MKASTVYMTVILMVAGTGGTGYAQDENSRSAAFARPTSLPEESGSDTAEEPSPGRAGQDRAAAYLVHAPTRGVDEMEPLEAFYEEDAELVAPGPRATTDEGVVEVDDGEEIDVVTETAPQDYVDETAYDESFMLGEEKAFTPDYDAYDTFEDRLARSEVEEIRDEYVEELLQE